MAEEPFVYRTHLDDLREFREFIDDFEACFVCSCIMSDEEIDAALRTFLDRAGKLLRPGNS